MYRKSSFVYITGNKCIVNAQYSAFFVHEILIMHSVCAL